METSLYEIKRFLDKLERDEVFARAVYKLPIARDMIFRASRELKTLVQAYEEGQW